MNPHTEIHGVVYNGRRPKGRRATLTLGGSSVVLSTGARADASDGGREYERASVRVSPRIAGADRFLALPDGRQLQCADAPVLDELPQEEPSEGFVSWLERRSWVALLSIVATLAGGFALYRYLIPALAERAVAGISVEQERDLGENALAKLDRLVFEKSGLDVGQQRRIERRFADLTADLPNAGAYRLEFRGAPSFGANAIALPGAVIVVTDELVARCESDDRVLAVLAHEAGHIEQRHSLRQVLQDSTNAALALALTGDASALSVSAATLPLAFAQAQHSREFESEADTFAWQALANHGLSPELFAEALERIVAKRRLEESEWDFTRTHPVTRERIARARARAHGRDAQPSGPKAAPGN